MKDEAKKYQNVQSNDVTFSIHDGSIFDCFLHFDNFDSAEKGNPNLVKNHAPHIASRAQIGP